MEMEASKKNSQDTFMSHDDDLPLLQKLEALESVLNEAQPLLVDIKDLIAESQNYGGGRRKEKSQEEEKASGKWRKQYIKEKKSKEAEPQRLQDNRTYVLKYEGSINVNTTRSVMTQGSVSGTKVTSMLTFSFSSNVYKAKAKPVKGGGGDGDGVGLPKRSNGGRQTRTNKMMLTASELGVVAMGYGDGTIALHDSSGKKLALWNNNAGTTTDGSPVVKLAFQSKQGRSVLVALNANGQLSSFEIGAWRWGRCISGGGEFEVHAHQLNNKLKNEMKGGIVEYWNVVERERAMSEDGLVVAIRSIEEEEQPQQVTIEDEEGKWCNGDEITAIEPIVIIGGKKPNPMKLILAVGSASGNMWVMRGSDRIKIASFSQAHHTINDRGPVIAIKRSGNYLAVAFKRSSQLIVYRIPRNLMSDVMVDKKREDVVVPVEINTYSGCDAFADITSLYFDHTLSPSILFVGLENGYVMSISLKLFKYESKQYREKLGKVYLPPCQPKCATVVLPEAVHSLSGVKGYVLASGTSSAVMLNATLLSSLGLRRAFDVIVPNGNSDGLKLYEALLPQVAKPHNSMKWVRLPVFLIVLLTLAWHRLRNSNKRNGPDFLMGNEETDLRFKEVEMELSRLERQRLSNERRRLSRNHQIKNRLRLRDSSGLQQRSIPTDANHELAQDQDHQTHLIAKGKSSPSHRILEEDKEKSVK